MNIEEVSIGQRVRVVGYRYPLYGRPWVGREGVVVKMLPDEQAPVKVDFGTCWHPLYPDELAPA